MKFKQRFFGLLGLLPLACGGEEPGGGTGPDDGDGCPGGVCPGEDGPVGGNDDGQPPAVGYIVVTAEPTIESPQPFQLFVDDQMMVEVPVGGAEGRVEVRAGVPLDVKIICPGYGYAVAGYEWISDSQPVSEWEMRDIVVAANTEHRINATVCRDLTGRWTRLECPECGVEDAWMISQNDHCIATGAFGFALEVVGDTAIVAAGGCTGISAPIQNNGTLITFNCAGDVYTFTKLE